MLDAESYRIIQEQKRRILQIIDETNKQAVESQKMQVSLELKVSQQTQRCQIF